LAAVCIQGCENASRVGPATEEKLKAALFQDAARRPEEARSVTYHRVIDHDP
jgi:hypothetical protein